MRLWHKDLIPVLPRQQLLGQWRECCLIAKNISEHGAPNHILVNKIMDYPIGHFIQYGCNIADEMRKRYYKVDSDKFFKYFDIDNLPFYNISNKELFKDWHTDRYLTQCIFNLEEKFDCGGIPKEEWFKIQNYLAWDGEAYYIR